MGQLEVAFIGTGPEPDNPVWGKSAAMAYRHAAAYEDHPSCRLVACADIVEPNASAFADRTGIGPSNVFSDYGEMLDAVQPDVVSICTPVPTHEPIVVDCISSGVKAIHCEKPMADTMAGSRRMVEAAARTDVQLTFNHQRRVATPTRRLADLVADGAIGEVTRVELETKNLFDAGTHLIDLCNFVLDDPDAEWAIGQIDYRTENVRYGVHNENQAFARWRYEGGIDAVAAMGTDADFIDCDLRVLGTDGAAELNPAGEAQLRVKRGETASWEELDTGEPMADIPAAIADVVTGLETGTEPALSARRALGSAQIIFACYESARRRGRVDLPLSIDDNPLVSMVEVGDLSPQPVTSEND